MSFDTLDDVANRLDKLEILYQEMLKEYQCLLETTDETACKVGKELGELAIESKAQKSAMEDIRHRFFFMVIRSGVSLPTLLKFTGFKLTGFCECRKDYRRQV